MMQSPCVKKTEKRKRTSEHVAMIKKTRSINSLAALMRFKLRSQEAWSPPDLVKFEFFELVNSS